MQNLKHQRHLLLYTFKPTDSGSRSSRYRCSCNTTYHRHAPRYAMQYTPNPDRDSGRGACRLVSLSSKKWRTLQCMEKARAVRTSF